MRTVSATPPKGEERARSFLDDWFLLAYIARLGFNYLMVGRPIRKRFRELQRSGEKLYVDEAPRCIYYFCETSGCAICIEVCPWSEAGAGPWLSEKLLSKREAPR